MKQSAAQKLLESMKAGRVYRRLELSAFSTSLTRDLKKLVEDKKVVRASAGLYYRPKLSCFGSAPATSEELVRAFLNDNDFLFISFNEYNLLGLGLTQLYNQQFVYNRKRYGDFVLDGRRFTFRRPRNFPKELSREFLFIDFLNNKGDLSGATKDLENLIALQSKELPNKKLLNAAIRYGKVGTRKFFKNLVAT